MAKWTHSKNRSLKDHALVIKYDAKASRSLHILWAVMAIIACTLVYNLK